MPELFLSTDEIALECPPILGISCSLKAYKLAWKIERSNDYLVERMEDAQNYNDNGHHTLYELQHKDEGTLLYLVRNKGTYGFFYKKFKNFQYLLFNKDAEMPMDNNSITLIRALEGVSLCLELEVPQEADKMNFIQLL